MSARQINVPIVFRGPNCAASGVGAQHSHVCFSLHFLLYETSVNYLFTIPTVLNWL